MTLNKHALCIQAACQALLAEARGEACALEASIASHEVAHLITSVGVRMIKVCPSAHYQFPSFRKGHLERSCAAKLPVCYWPTMVDS